MYENKYGFVPHNYACFSEEINFYRRKFCDKFSQYTGEHNWVVEDGTLGRGPIVCNCNNGECKWNDKEGQGQSYVVWHQGSFLNAKIAIYISQCQFENGIMLYTLKYAKIFCH